MDLFEAEFTPEQAYDIIWWLVHLLGDRVTINKGDEFWQTNMPQQIRLAVDHDSEGNPVLVSQQLEWT